MAKVVLPPLPRPVDELNTGELRSLVSACVRESIGVRPQYGDKRYKPVWWPKNVAFVNPKQIQNTNPGSVKCVDLMRALLRKGYQHYNQVDKLKGNPEAYYGYMNGTPNQQESPVPERVFRNLQATTPTIGDQYASLPPAASFNYFGSKPSNDDTVVEIFLCVFCEREFSKKTLLQEHQYICPKRFRRMSTRSSTKTKFVPPDVIPRKRIPLKEDVYHKPKLNVFIERLNLVPLKKALDIQRTRSVSANVECENLLGNEAVVLPKSPTTPRSLMSQLSHTSAIEPRQIFKDEERESKKSGETSDSDSDEWDEPEHIKAAKKPMPSLFNIDITSGLGSRIKNTLEQSVSEKTVSENRNENKTELSRNYETYCHTPSKNNTLQKLRNRGDPQFPVTFRKTKKTFPKNYHLFKFNKKQRRDWYRFSKSGLNQRSRGLVRYITKCSVKVQKLSKNTIQQWCREDYLFPALADFQKKEREKEEKSRLLELLQQRELEWSINKRSFGHQVARLPGSRQHSSYLLQQFLNGAGPSTSAMEAELTPPNTPPESATQAYARFQQYQPNTFNALNFYRSQNSLGSKKQSNFDKWTSVPSANKDGAIVIDDDDVISISSNEEEDMPNKKRKRVEDMHEPEAKRPKPAVAPQPTMLFKCHLCAAEITCRGQFGLDIRKHFVDRHGVTNISVIEHTEANGQKVMSIVEDNSLTNSPPSPAPAPAPPRRRRPGPLSHQLSQNAKSMNRPQPSMNKPQGSTQLVSVLKQPPKVSTPNFSQDEVICLD